MPFWALAQCSLLRLFDGRRIRLRLVGQGDRRAHRGKRIALAMQLPFTRMMREATYDHGQARKHQGQFTPNAMAILRYTAPSAQKNTMFKTR